MRRFRNAAGVSLWLGRLAVLLGFIIALPFIVAPLEAEQQAWLAVGGLLVFAIVSLVPGKGSLVFLALLSGVISTRYIYWRITDTLDYTNFFSTFLGTGLLLAEIYAVVALLLSYLQSLWPLERRPAPLPEDPEYWPTVDVFIPTYNEPLEVVKPTVFAAMAMDWPRHKMNVVLLDDGRREEFRAFCAQVGCGYMIRPDNKGAKAGNINHALSRTDGEYVVIFDCDHVATRAFLQMTMGWMLRDAGLAMVQTPHHFYSPDPFERNLASGTRVPNEGLLFYGLIQQGNDLWNAAFFCGSCAVIRRTALEQIGGVPTETVTEDCHASLKMQRLGWRTAYLRLPLAAGLATDRLVAHIGQRMRWARGMVQIFRIENPLLGPGLSLTQRLCYVASMWHFLFPVPRFIFLTAPLAFLLFGQNIIAASPLAIVAYAAPHVVHAVLTNSKLQARVRHSFWSEIYETVLALYLLPVVVTTLLDPKRGKFNVTDKGGTLDEGYFDFRATGPNFILAVVLVLGLLSGIYGMAAYPYESLEFQANALNTLWVVLSLLTVLAGLAVGRERRQVRERARVGAIMPLHVSLPDGRLVPGETLDLSLGGAAVAAARPEGLPDNAVLTLEIELGPERVTIPAEALRWQDGRLQVRFVPQNLRDEGNITRVVLGRADAWVDWDDVRHDRPMRSLGEVVRSIGGLFRGDSQFSFRARRARRLAAARAQPARAVAPSRGAEAAQRRSVERARRSAAVLLALGLGLPVGAAAQSPRPQAPTPPPAINQGQGSFTPPPPPGSGPAPAQFNPGQVPAPAGLPQYAPTPVPGQPAPAAAPTASPPGLNPPAVMVAPSAPITFGGETQPGIGSRTETRTLRQLGLRSPMQLRGLADLQGLLFGIRSDEVVTSAKLTLQGATSPALIPELSQIAITMNEQFVGTITPDRARPAFGPVEFQINPVFFADSNRLNFRFTGRYAVECNDPLSGLLWSTVSDLSTLQLTLERLPLNRDLARLPEPFFDVRLLREPLVLPVVMAEGAGNDAVRAAVVTSSWFAVQADYRGAAFPVSSVVPSRGNAVVIATGSDSLPGLTLPRMEGPTLAILPSPNDPASVLLLVGGRSGAEAAVAAQVLATAKEGLSGELATVAVNELPARRPYDAPRWIRNDRPVRFGELVDPSELQSYGYAPGPVSVPFRTAPDLYTFRDRNLPVDVRFRAPPGPILDLAVSRLDAALNDVYLKSFPLREGEAGWPWNWVYRTVGSTASAERGEGTVGLPPYLVFGLNELQFRFDLRPLHRGDCVSVPGDIRSSIDPDSTIDLSAAYRYTELPNLAYFVGSGFPYTRMADLSSTAVVLPDRASPVEISTALNLIGRIAAIVGYPATRIEVARPGGLEAVSNRDLLVIGPLNRQPALSALLRDGPITVEGNRVNVALPDALDNFRNIFISDDRRLDRERLTATLGGNQGEGIGLLIGFQSPLNSDRSVVALTGSSQQGMEAMVAALRDPEQQPRIQGDVAHVSNGQVTSFKVSRNYGVGSLPITLLPQRYLTTRPDLMLGLLVIAALVIAIPLYWTLRRRAISRLRTRA
ncbi:UDP-forming cellulose synthase catalytic subunit [Roseomonas sp. SSH11]|uniref:Cellulose synthase catalytic subunit [UDP-forming] n=1 Tax=Pararoseomonas baculiformis TaxID=2820812 RepID=A0ABS4AK13_9PROT|nr:UDP-forming cellulose synthase catalytic subunit [Pararoseomonas baculiformis]MBP0447374.1 UDP-forming cellulose synthase catalytic subunit [Pararoseomonas baculiformis]